MGGEQSGVTQRAEVFGGIKTERAKVAHAADGNTFPRGTLRLSGVLDDMQRMGLGELADGGHVGGLAKQMDGENGFGAVSDFSSGVLGVEVKGVRMGVDKHWRGARAGNAAGGGEESEGRAQHFIARPNAEAHQR